MVELDVLNAAVQQDLAAFVETSEEKYRCALQQICEEISAGGCRALLIAGPSCAGKTTTSMAAAKALSCGGARRVIGLSLDDYFYDVDYQRSLYGEEADFDAIEALDVALLHRQLAQMMQGETVRLPRFDFLQGRRVDSGQTVTLGAGDLLIVEGIHALHPQVTAAFSGMPVQTLFINVEEEVCDRGRVLLRRRDLRFLRRIVRDYRFRGSSVENTYRLWQNVVKNEERSLFPYSSRAAYHLNTFIAYECALLSGDVQALLPSAPPAYAADADRLLQAVSRFDPVARSVVPNGSLLEEFVGRY